MRNAAVHNAAVSIQLSYEPFDHKHRAKYKDLDTLYIQAAITTAGSRLLINHIIESIQDLEVN